jgi:hypothetical protein
VTEASRVRLHPLSMRPDNGAWVIGRVETGEFIAAPAVARRAITLLAEGGTVEEVRSALRTETGDDVDVADFVAALGDLGFVSHIDDRPVHAAAPPAPTLRRLRPRQVRWLLHPATAGTTVAIIVAGAVAMLADRELVPGYHDLIWSGSGGLVILGNAAIAWTINLIHELAHLTTARAAGIPGRMSLSTRLQFLVAQTDVTGVWAAPRRTRLTVYLAGMAVNLLIAALCLLALPLLDPAGLGYRLVTATALLSLLFIPPQLLVFMRTDLYFVIQDLTGCANLYADGSRYFWYGVRRICRGVLGGRPAGEPPADPTRRLPARERRAVRAYTVLLVGGTIGCLGVAAAVTLPVAFTLLGRAVAAITGGGAGTELYDALAVLTVVGGLYVLWARAWWRRHGHRVSRLLGPFHRATGGG